MGEIATLRITTTPPPPDSTRTAVKNCHSWSPWEGEGNNPKQILVLPKYVFFLLYSLLLGDLFFPSENGKDKEPTHTD